MKPACFLDRDGVIVEDVGYLSDPDDLQLIDGAANAIRRLNKAEVPVVVVTNQAGVARGLFVKSLIAVVHERLEQMLSGFDARIDAIYYCPHHPTAGQGEYGIECECRKPKPGMLQRAAADHGLDLPRSFLVGDKVSDLGAGQNAGCETILVRTGYGSEVDDAALAKDGYRPSFMARDISEAVDFCLPALTRPGTL